MYVALKNFATTKHYYYKGQEVPDLEVSYVLLERGIVGKAEDLKKPEIVVKKMKVNVSEAAKEYAKKVEEHKTESKEEILTEDTSDVKVEKTESKKKSKK